MAGKWFSEISSQDRPKWLSTAERNFIKPRSSHYSLPCRCTGFSSHLGAKLRDLANRQAEAGCYSQAALSSNDSKTRYIKPDVSKKE